MLKPWDQGRLLDVLGREGVAAFASAVAQGVLTGKILAGVPEGSRARRTARPSVDEITRRRRPNGLRTLNEVARSRGGGPAATSWALCDLWVTLAPSASSVAELEENWVWWPQPASPTTSRPRSTATRWSCPGQYQHLDLLGQVGPRLGQRGVARYQGRLFRDSDRPTLL